MYFFIVSIAAGTKEQEDIARDAVSTVLRKVLFRYKYIIKEPAHVRWFTKNERCPQELESIEKKTRVAIEVKQVPASSVRVIHNVYLFKIFKFFSFSLCNKIARMQCS